MTPVQIIVLSLVQAVTEFLPVSSSGHLILVPYFLGWPDQGLAFDIATNTGTVIALLVYFRGELKDLLVGFFTGDPGSHDFPPRPLAWSLVLATIPAAVLGLLVHHRIESEARNPLLIAGTAVFYGLLLGFADRRGRQERELAGLSWRDALLIGCAQALALVPGTSRSGITITAALLLGFTRTTAARFSFLLSVPVGILVTIYEVAKLAREGAGWAQIGPMLAAIAITAVAGYLVIGWLLAWVRSQRLTVFVAYRLALAAVILAVVVVRH